jgi:hypothetical protein
MPNTDQKVLGASANSLRDICRYNLCMPDLYSVSAKYYDEACMSIRDACVGCSLHDRNVATPMLDSFGGR